MTITTYLSTITLNANGLKALIKTHRVAEWLRKHHLYICCLKDTYLRMKDTHMESKGMKKGISCKQKQTKKDGVASFCQYLRQIKWTLKQML